jgi:hypothetical protein
LGHGKGHAYMLLEATNIAFVNDAFITINVDEVMTINNI